MTPLSFNENSFKNSNNYEEWNPSEEFIENINKEYSNECIKFNTFLATYPITIACGLKSMDMNERSRSFKEEYIIPQLILQNLTLNNIDGVSYLATSLGENKEVSLFTNYAFPANPEDEDFLKSKFRISTPLVLAEARNITNYNIRKLHSDSVRALENMKSLTKYTTGFYEIISLDDSIIFGYSATDFGTIDIELRKSIITSLKNEGNA